MAANLEVKMNELDWIVRRWFTTEGIDPFDEVEWEQRTARIAGSKGEVVFEQADVEVPKFWSQNATNIVASKYFRGQLGTPQREWSVKQLIGRVVNTITGWGIKDGYFDTEQEALVFAAELKHLLLYQKAAFNSPVWFNIGVPGEPQQGSACFILSIQDTMESILEWYRTEGLIFKGGSGSGVNLSPLRSSKEPLSSGGSASGPVSFMRGADAIAGTIKSGGKCFRAGTLIATPDGLRPIESLKIGDLVLAHKGPRPVADFMPNGRKQCYRVRSREGYEVEVTRGHKFAYWDATLGIFAVKPIESFAPGETLYLLLEASEGGMTIPLILPEWDDPLHATTIVEMKFPVELDEELAYVLGLMYGDADLRTEYPYQVRVAFAKETAGYASAARFREYCVSLFGKEPLLLRDEAGYQVLGFTRKRVIEFLVANELAKGKADVLGFPKVLYRALPKVRAAFIAGVIDADGTYQPRGGWSISSIDRAFLVELQRLLLTLGIPSKLKLNREQNGSWQPLYRLSVVGYTFVKRLVERITPHSSKAIFNYEPSDGADKGWGYRPSLYAPLVSRVERRGGYRLVERTVGMNETTGYGALTRLATHPDVAVADYAKELSHCVQVTLQSVEPTEVAETYDIEVEDVHLLSANGLYASNTRRAAKMLVLNIDHPDIIDFIWCKAKEEKKAYVLGEAGYDMSLNGEAWISIQYQNANNSVRVTDDFMRAVLEDKDWPLKAVTTGKVLETHKARDLLQQIAQAAWECADPGLQYDTTINDWHTTPSFGRITASNPCAEYLSNDDTSCNLSSLNLLKFLNEDGDFDVESFEQAAAIMILAQEILVGNASYPTERIRERTVALRQLGLGYANLGALLMGMGVPYDSDEGWAFAGAVTALMSGHAYAISALIAKKIGPFAGYKENEEPMLRVMRKHRNALAKINTTIVPAPLYEAAAQAWDEAVRLGELYGYRNAQATVIAPTGCLVSNSLIATDQGLVHLKSLGNPQGNQWQDVSFRVFTDEGAQVATKFYVNGLAPTRRIRTTAGYTIQGTPRHRIKIVDPATGEFVWRRLGDVLPGDIVPLAMNTILGKPREVRLPPLGEVYWTGDYETRVPRTVTPELAELVGYFMGDGSLHSKGLRFCVTKQDIDVVEHLCTLLHSLFNLKAHVTRQEGYWEVSVNSVPLVLWWEACGFAKREPEPDHRGKGYQSHIPDALLYTNDRSVYTAFLRGLFEADGTVIESVPSFSNTHGEFVEEVKSLLLALGYPTTTKKDESAWGQSTVYASRLRNRGYNAGFLRDIGFIGHRKTVAVAEGEGWQVGKRDRIPIPRALIEELVPPNSSHRDAVFQQLRRYPALPRQRVLQIYAETGDERLAHALQFFYDSVESNQEGGEQPTYDLSVPANFTYTAGGFISHNTISFMMDCDTTGVEPDLALVKYKTLVGGGVMKIVNQTVPLALQRLGYTSGEIEAIVRFIDEKGTIEGAPHHKAEHLPVFDCAFRPPNGTRFIHYMGHVKMLAAVQPFISGSISKTVNLPHDVTVDEVKDLYIEGWRLGLKALAIYRDQSKRVQPMSTTQGEEEWREQVRPTRRRLPEERQAVTHKFSVGGQEGYITVGLFEDGTPGEVFLTIAKEGSTISGLMDVIATQTSLALQYGVPLKDLVRKFINTRFEPAGVTNNPQIRFATSIIDYVFRWLGLKFLPLEDLVELGLVAKGAEEGEGQPAQEVSALAKPEQNGRAAHIDGPPCFDCGAIMVRTGSCYGCLNCGATRGCS